VSLRPRSRAAAGPRSLVPAGRRLARWIALVILLVLPLQASGVVHVVTDAALSVAGLSSQADATPCPYEEDGERCPPGCPDCHCAPAVPALLPVMPSVVLRRLAFCAPDGHSAAASLSPRPVLPGLERPPRDVRSFA
jgi:hypothetical protein